eukprot:scaffold64733_cov62-Phaeocystis_antarctica.AAC.12
MHHGLGRLTHGAVHDGVSLRNQAGVPRDVVAVLALLLADVLLLRVEEGRQVGLGQLKEGDLHRVGLLRRAQEAREVLARLRRHRRRRGLVQDEGRRLRQLLLVLRRLCQQGQRRLDLDGDLGGGGGLHRSVSGSLQALRRLRRSRCLLGRAHGRLRVPRRARRHALRYLPFLRGSVLQQEGEGGRLGGGLRVLGGLRRRERLRLRLAVGAGHGLAPLQVLLLALPLDLRLHLAHGEDTRSLCDAALLRLLSTTLLLLLGLDAGGVVGLLLLLLGELRKRAGQLHVARLLTHGNVRSPRRHGRLLLRSRGRLRAVGLLRPGELLASHLSRERRGLRRPGGVHLLREARRGEHAHEVARELGLGEGRVLLRRQVVGGVPRARGAGLLLRRHVHARLLPRRLAHLVLAVHLDPEGRGVPRLGVRRVGNRRGERVLRGGDLRPLPQSGCADALCGGGHLRHELGLLRIALVGQPPHLERRVGLHRGGLHLGLGTQPRVKIIQAALDACGRHVRVLPHRLVLLLVLLVLVLVLLLVLVPVLVLVLLELLLLLLHGALARLLLGTLPLRLPGHPALLLLCPPLRLLRAHLDLRLRLLLLLLQPLPLWVPLGRGDHRQLLLGGRELQVLESLLELVLRPLERGKLPRNVAAREGVDLCDGLGRELVCLVDGGGARLVLVRRGEPPEHHLRLGGLLLAQVGLDLALVGLAQQAERDLLEDEQTLGILPARLHRELERLRRVAREGDDLLGERLLGLDRHPRAFGARARRLDLLGHLARHRMLVDLCGRRRRRSGHWHRLRRSNLLRLGYLGLLRGDLRLGRCGERLLTGEGIIAVQLDCSGWRKLVCCPVLHLRLDPRRHPLHLRGPLLVGVHQVGGGHGVGGDDGGAVRAIGSRLRAVDHHGAQERGVGLGQSEERHALRARLGPCVGSTGFGRELRHGHGPRLGVGLLRELRRREHDARLDVGRRRPRPRLRIRSRRSSRGDRPGLRRVRPRLGLGHLGPGLRRRRPRLRRGHARLLRLAQHDLGLGGHVGGGGLGVGIMHEGMHLAVRIQACDGIEPRVRATQVGRHPRHHHHRLPREHRLGCDRLGSKGGGGVGDGGGGDGDRGGDVGGGHQVRRTVVRCGRSAPVVVVRRRGCCGCCGSRIHSREVDGVRQCAVLSSQAHQLLCALDGLHGGRLDLLICALSQSDESLVAGLSRASLLQLLQGPGQLEHGQFSLADLLGVRSRLTIGANGANDIASRRYRRDW